MSANDEPQFIHNSPTVSKRVLCIQLFYSVSANLPNLSTGMGFTFPTISLDTLQDTTQPVYLTESQGSWYSSINMLMAPIGGLLLSFVLDRIGRKNTLILANFISIVSWIIIGFTTRESSYLMYMQLMIARVSIGIVIGLGNASSIYNGEIAHPSIRGRLVALAPISLSTGALIIYILGLFLSTNFRLAALIACGIAIFSIFLGCFIPESPNWLVLRNQVERAKKSLIRLNGLKDINNATSQELDKELDVILERIIKARSATTGQRESFLKIILKETVYKPLILTIGVFVIQQLSGIFVVIVYGAQFAKASGILFDPFLCAVFIGITRVVGSVAVTVVLDKCGRKPPLIISAAGMATCLFLLALLQWLHIHNAWVAVLILVYVFTAAIGFLTVPFTLASEMFPEVSRGFCLGLTMFVCFGTSFAILKVYHLMEAYWHINTIYMFFCVTSILGALFVWFLLPETKCKTLAEIEDAFISKKNRSDV